MQICFKLKIFTYQLFLVFLLAFVFYIIYTIWTICEEFTERRKEKIMSANKLDEDISRLRSGGNPQKNEEDDKSSQNIIEDDSLGFTIISVGTSFIEKEEGEQNLNESRIDNAVVDRAKSNDGGKITWSDVRKRGNATQVSSNETNITRFKDLAPYSNWQENTTDNNIESDTWTNGSQVITESGSLGGSCHDSKVTFDEYSSDPSVVNYVGACPSRTSVSVSKESKISIQRSTDYKSQKNDDEKIRNPKIPSISDISMIEEILKPNLSSKSAILGNNTQSPSRSHGGEDKDVVSSKVSNLGETALDQDKHLKIYKPTIASEESNLRNEETPYPHSFTRNVSNKARVTKTRSRAGEDEEENPPAAEDDNEDQPAEGKKDDEDENKVQATGEEEKEGKAVGENEKKVQIADNKSVHNADESDSKSVKENTNENNLATTSKGKGKHCNKPEAAVDKIHTLVIVDETGAFVECFQFRESDYHKALKELNLAEKFKSESKK